MEIETDYETVEVDCENVEADYETVVERVQRLTLAAERKEKARRRAEFFAARDAAFEKAGLPIPKIEERGGVRVERRGTCVGGAAFNPTVPISPKSYYYR